MTHLRSLLIAGVLLLTTGCATDIAHWIAQTRDHQGDVALARQNYPDASVAYQLALKVSPHDEHARAGLVTVQLRLAEFEFANSKFDDAIDAIALAAKYSPDDERIAALRSAIEQAEIKRDIVVTNFPSYKETSTSIRRSYAAVKRATENIGTAVAKFEYTYDTNELTRAIRQSSELEADVARNTKRLATLRQLVESGVPESKGSEGLAPPASLLPLP